MQQQNLQQISDLMDQKFEKNNEKLKKDIVNEVGAITNQSFGEFEKKAEERFDKMDKRFDKMDKRFDKMDKRFDKMDKRFDKMDEELAKRPTKKEIFDWADKRIVNVELDMDKIKYLHRKEWKKLPRAYEIKKILIESGIA